MNLDNHGRITHYPDSKGRLQPVIYPRGNTYAVCDAVCMIQTARDTFAVVYGLQTTLNLSSDEAASQFGQSVIHQGRIECHYNSRG